MPTDFSHVYVDESAVPAHDLLVAGLVFSRVDLSPSVADVLERNGFRPGLDEYKSTLQFRENPRWQDVRIDLMDLLHETESRVAVCVCSYVEELRTLGNMVVGAAVRVADHVGLEPRDLSIFLDRDLHRDERALRSAHAPSRTPSLHFDIDSHIVGGIQTADMIAGLVRTIIIEEILGNPKTTVRGPEGGYDPGTEFMLSEDLLMGLAWLFFAEQLPPDRFGWQNEWTALPVGAHLSDALSPVVRAAAEDRLGSLWRGCAH